MSRRLLLTVNHGNYLHRVHRESFASAADRWGCDYLELKPDAGEFFCCAARELWLSKPVPWDRVCWIDGDCLIRADATSIFDAAANPARIWGVGDLDTTPLSDCLLYTSPSPRDS